MSELYLSLYKTGTENEYFALEEAPFLKSLVEPKYPTVKYVNVEYLHNNGEIVLNISLYDEADDHVGGAEITKEAIFWDDEN
jgi:hypothetical protein